MVIDTSAMIACLFDEPERISFIDAIDGAEAKLISVVSFVEASFVILGKKGEDGIVGSGAIYRPRSYRKRAGGR